MKTKEKLMPIKPAADQAARMVETIFGCKWSLTIYKLLDSDINRPGEMVRAVDGLSTKVLNECLRRNIEFGILKRHSFNEVPPRVEYSVTPFGEQFIRVVDEIEKLQQAIDQKSDYRRQL